MNSVKVYCLNGVFHFRFTLPAIWLGWLFGTLALAEACQMWYHFHNADTYKETSDVDERRCFYAINKIKYNAGAYTG